MPGIERKDSLLVATGTLVSVLGAFVSLAGTASPQGNRVESNVGSLVEPSWLQVGSSSITMAPFGGSVWFMELLPGGCHGGPERVSGISGDGTGYHVLLDPIEVGMLHPGVSSTRVVELVAAGNNQTLAAFLPESLAGCSLQFPWHVWLIDTSSGAFEELSPGWSAGVFGPSFSDDGDRIVYVASDTVGRYIVTARRSSATSYATDVEILFAPGGLGVSYLAQLSGDGQSVVFVAYQGFTVDDPGFLYQYHLASGRLRQLVEEPVFDVRSLSVSRDGRRVLYGLDSDPGNVLPLHGVSDGGAETHVVTPTHVFGSGTLSRDGQWVYFTDMAADFTFDTWRVPWEGGAPEYVGSAFYNLAAGGTRYPLSADGALVALRDNFDVQQYPLPPQPLTLVRFGPRWLTTYGPEAPGQPLHCDVGGAPGAAFTLFGSLYETSLRTKYGHLHLEPSRMTLLGQGVVAGPDNVATVPFQVPDDPVLLDVTYHFQALVSGTSGSADAALTNRTSVTFGDAP